MTSATLLTWIIYGIAVVMEREERWMRGLQYVHVCRNAEAAKCKRQSDPAVLMRCFTSAVSE